MQKPVYPEITVAQWEVLSAWTDQRCTNMLDAADFLSDLTEKQKAFLKQAEPETLDFLRRLRPEEVKGLEAYLLLRSTSSYLAWGIGSIVVGLAAILLLWDRAKLIFAGVK